MTEILFIVGEDQEGYHAKAVGVSIVAQADTREELVKNVREAVLGHFHSPETSPRIAHLHYVHDETIAIERGTNIGDLTQARGDSGSPRHTAEEIHRSKEIRESLKTPQDETNKTGAMSYPLRGKQPYQFDDPFSPVGVEDWEALK